MCRVGVPAALRPLTGGQATVPVEHPDGAALAAVLDVLADSWPGLGHRIRDEQGALRRYVNVYVDGEDARRLAGLDTPVPARAELLIVPSVAGG